MKYHPKYAWPLTYIRKMIAVAFMMPTSAFNEEVWLDLPPPHGIHWNASACIVRGITFLLVQDYGSGWGFRLYRAQPGGIGIEVFLSKPGGWPRVFHGDEQVAVWKANVVVDHSTPALERRWELA